jgi:hypothetical protein
VSRHFQIPHRAIHGGDFGRCEFCAATPKCALPVSATFVPTGADDNYLGLAPYAAAASPPLKPDSVSTGWIAASVGNIAKLLRRSSSFPSAALF